tara:strand:+ start:122 stop:355 length:234 start_codon:yes stop_codon:yes gene_type:complete
MTDAEYTADMGTADVPATMESVAIVEKIRAISESDRTDEEKGELFRNEGHIVIKMAWTEFVKALSSDQKAKIDALSL